MDQLQEAIHEEISHFQSRSTNQNNDEELTSTIDKLFTHDRPMENHHRVVIIDSTPPVASTSQLQIDTTRLVEKKRKHRRKFFLFLSTMKIKQPSGRKHSHVQHHHSKRSCSTTFPDEQPDSGDTNDEDMIDAP